MVSKKTPQYWLWTFDGAIETLVPFELVGLVEVFETGEDELLLGEEDWGLGEETTGVTDE